MYKYLTVSHDFRFFFYTTINFSLTPFLLVSIFFLLYHSTNIFKMSRHNRRRTRGSHKAQHSSFLQYESNALPSLCAVDSPNDPKLSVPKHPRRNDLSARHWHNRYLAWQVRERRQREEREKLRAEQKRIFGGDSQDGDDEEGLCVRMMDYFVGLDYLEDG